MPSWRFPVIRRILGICKVVCLRKSEGPSQFLQTAAADCLSRPAQFALPQTAQLPDPQSSSAL